MGVQLGYASGQAAASSRYQGRGKAATKDSGAKDLRPQFRLRPGQDDLLIEWLTSLAPRRRSAAIREILYQHLVERQEAEKGGGDWAEDPDLAAALDALF